MDRHRYDLERDNKMDDKGKGMMCCICGAEIEGFGNNPYPVKRKHPFPNGSGRCCDRCNASIVVPIRILLISNDIEIER